MLWAIATLGWTASVVLAVGAGHTMHHGTGGSTFAGAPRIAASATVWVVMVAAMMLPTTVPMARLVAVVTSRLARPGPVLSILYASYLAIWTAFGLLALAANAGLQAVAGRWPWLGAHSGVVLAGALALAGGFQFTALKNRCLTACRDPMSMLWQHYRRGPAGAWRLGTRHALSCLGCCWALMLLLTAVMGTEKTARWGARLSAPVGITLLVAATVVSLGAFGIGPVAGSVN